MPEASGLTYMEGAVEGGADDWGEVVTRQPYRKVRLDHLLSKEESKGWFIIELSRRLLKENLIKFLVAMR